MCHGHVDARTLEREAMDRMHAARPVMRTETRAEAGPPPELMGGFAGVVARLRRLAGALLPGLRAGA